MPLPVNTVLSVDIGGATFANPSGGDRPEVSASPGCAVPPLPSPYLAPGNGSYTRYAVNISTGGCQAGAEVTLKEAVAGTAGARITQSVTVPGFNAATASFVLPAGTANRHTATAAATPTAAPMLAPAITLTPTSPATTSAPATATATDTPRPTDTLEPTATPTAAASDTDQHSDTDTGEHADTDQEQHPDTPSSDAAPGGEPDQPDHSDSGG
jgi:hypothetical protein